MFDRLAALHQQRWEKRGRAGAFASARFRRFHESLIQRAFPLGAVQLLEVSAGEHTIGLIYNLVHRGKVYFYQAGFNYDDAGRASPGTVTLYHAIQYCSEVGLNEFDFLAGDDQYKKSLSTGCRHLVWAAFRRPHWKFRVLDWLRRVNTLAKHSGRRSAL
jgi:CelD/BcsL family acetyltransferase involved in cellulose biosynthesis